MLTNTNRDYIIASLIFCIIFQVAHAIISVQPDYLIVWFRTDLILNSFYLCAVLVAVIFKDSKTALTIAIFGLITCVALIVTGIPIMINYIKLISNVYNIYCYYLLL